MSDAEDRSRWTRIARLLAGELSGEEREEARRELRADGQTRARLEAAEEVWRLTSGSNGEDARWDRDRGWRAVDGRARSPGAGAPADARDAPPVEPADPSRHDVRSASRSSALRSVLKAAAAILLLAGGWWAYRASPLSEPSPDSQLRTYATEEAQRLTLRLADGSSVVLGPESELQVPRELDGREVRRVELLGLGYFEVESSSERPFVVATRRGELRVLGTKFSARAYATDSTNTVVVEEGSVRLEPDGAPEGSGSVLEAGQAATHSSGRVLSTRRVDVERQLAWRDGRLTFDGAPLRQVVEDLERWYGVDFEIADPALADERFTGDFCDEPIRRIADVLALSLDLTYEVRDSTVILSAPDR